MAYFVSGVEFVWRILADRRFFSSRACVALLVDMLVAILTTKLSAMPKGLSPRLGLYGQVQRNPPGKEVTFGHARYLSSR